MGSVNKQEIINYLLGKIDPKKEDEFLAKCFSSDENAETYENVREDLIESYLRGNLSEEDKILFRNNFLKDPQHRELFIFAGALQEHLSENKQLAGVNVSEVSYNDEKKSFLLSSWLVPAVTFGTLLIGGFLVWQIYQRSQNQVIVKADPTPTPVIKQTPTPNTTPIEKETPDVEVSPTITPTISPTPEPTASPIPENKPIENNDKPTPPVRKSVTYTFILPLGSKGGDEDTLVIKREYKDIDLKMDRPEEKYSKYKFLVQKTGQNSKTILNETRNTLRDLGDGFTGVKISADKFETGRYRFIISGVKADGTVENLESTENFFNVRRID